MNVLGKENENMKKMMKIALSLSPCLRRQNIMDRIVGGFNIIFLFIVSLVFCLSVLVLFIVHVRLVANNWSTLGRGRGRKRRGEGRKGVEALPMPRLSSGRVS